MDLYHQTLQTTEKLFFKFVLEILAENKNIQANSEAWILIKLQRVIYQWICLNKLYKLMLFLNF